MSDQTTCEHCGYSNEPPDDACWCIIAACGCMIGPDANDLPPCEVCDRCENHCACEPLDDARVSVHTVAQEHTPCP